MAEKKKNSVVCGWKKKHPELGLEYLMPLTGNMEGIAQAEDTSLISV